MRKYLTLPEALNEAWSTNAAMRSEVAMSQFLLDYLR